MKVQGSTNQHSPRRSKQWKRVVLEGVAQGLTVKKACEVAGIHNTLVYRELKNDPEFRAAWTEMLDMSIVCLEAEAVRRAATTSDFLLWKILSARNKERYGDGSAVGATNRDPIKVEITVRDEDSTITPSA
jgi:hypothetical protein